jgi:leader peptidase (prepilin peptidase) / N-methyltransferase
MSVTDILLFGSIGLGAILGSFLNAFSFRYNTGVPFWSPRGMGGRSRCMHCSHELSAPDLVPLLSYLWLKGRCRYCGSAVSMQYPLVELIAAGISVLLYIKHPVFVGFTFVSPLPYLVWMLVWMTLLFVVIYDTKHTIIPPGASVLLGVVSFALLFINPATLVFSTPSVWSLAAGPLLALPLFLLSLVSRGTWMGWGDSGLELSLGWLLGLSMGASALMLAFWIGALWGVALLIGSRLGFFGYTIKSEVPFAPFLVLGAAVAYFLNVDFFSSFTLFF